MLSAENTELVDQKKLKRLFRKADKQTERILHGLVSISYELAPALGLHYKNRRWKELVENAQYILEVYTKIASKELESKVKRLIKLASNSQEDKELSEIVFEMEYLSKDVKGDVERFLL